MDYTIREAGINDSETIHELSTQLGYETSIAAVRNRLQKILENQDNCVYVAINSGRVVGWIHGFYTMRVETDFFVEIGGLVVHEHFRKHGIGKKLADKVIEWAVSRNCLHVRVRCNVIRKESHRFYETIGFEMNKEQKIFNKRLH